MSGRHPQAAPDLEERQLQLKRDAREISNHVRDLRPAASDATALQRVEARCEQLQILLRTMRAEADAAQSALLLETKNLEALALDGTKRLLGQRTMYGGVHGPDGDGAGGPRQPQQQRRSGGPYRGAPNGSPPFSDATEPYSPYNNPQGGRRGPPPGFF